MAPFGTESQQQAGNIISLFPPSPRYKRKSNKKPILHSPGLVFILVILVADDKRALEESGKLSATPAAHHLNHYQTAKSMRKTNKPVSKKT